MGRGCEAEPWGTGLGALLTERQQTREFPEVTKTCTLSRPPDVVAENTSRGEGMKSSHKNRWGEA